MKAKKDKKGIQPYTYIVRLDIAPIWVADGFILSDEIALQMLSERLECACMDTELAAQVIAAPDCNRIEAIQGYKNGAISEQIVSQSPKAYQKHSLLASLNEAIELLDSVAFVREESDNTADVLCRLKQSRELLMGVVPISDICWEDVQE